MHPGWVTILHIFYIMRNCFSRPSTQKVRLGLIFWHRAGRYCCACSDVSASFSGFPPRIHPKTASKEATSAVWQTQRQQRIRGVQRTSRTTHLVLFVEIFKRCLHHGGIYEIEWERLCLHRLERAKQILTLVCATTRGGEKGCR